VSIHADAKFTFARLRDFIPRNLIENARARARLIATFRGRLTQATKLKSIPLFALSFQAYSNTHFTSYNSADAARFGAFRAPAHAYQNYQSLTFAASQPAPLSYNVQPLNQYAYSSAAHSPQQQLYAQNIPFNHFAFNSAQPINPVLHASPVASFSGSYQAPANTFYVNPQQIHKVPIYSQQPQAFHASYHQPTNYHHQLHQQQQHVKQSSSPSQIITSKPLALETPHGPTSPSHVEHSHGAVSFSSFAHSPSVEIKPSGVSLIAAQQPQQVYYRQQPQPIYNGADYSKQVQYAAVPFASGFYPTQGGVHFGNAPYAHVSKIPFAQPTAASTLTSSVASPQKVAFY
jgi:hypothetical protein